MNSVYAQAVVQITPIVLALFAVSSVIRKKVACRKFNRSKTAAVNSFPQPESVVVTRSFSRCYKGNTPSKKSVCTLQL